MKKCLARRLAFVKTSSRVLGVERRKETIDVPTVERHRGRSFGRLSRHTSREHFVFSSHRLQTSFPKSCQTPFFTTTTTMLLTFRSVFAKAAILFAVRHSSLNSVNLPLTSKKISSLLIRTVPRDVAIHGSIDIRKSWYDGANRRVGEARLVFTITHDVPNGDVPAVVPEDGVQAPIVQD